MLFCSIYVSHFPIYKPNNISEMMIFSPWILIVDNVSGNFIFILIYGVMYTHIWNRVIHTCTCTYNHEKHFHHPSYLLIAIRKKFSYFYAFVCVCVAFMYIIYTHGVCIVLIYVYQCRYTL